MFEKREKLLSGNSYGGFSVEKNEYVIFNRLKTPKPWVNICTNPEFGTMVTESGGMFTWYKNSYLYRITPRIEDEVLRHGGEHIYLKDDVTGEIWQPTKCSLARHGKGYSVFSSNKDGLEVSIEVLVSVKNPIKFVRLSFDNQSKVQKIISATYFSELILGDDSVKSKKSLEIDFDSKINSIVAQNKKNKDFEDIRIFMGVNSGAFSYDLDRASFFGKDGSYDTPKALLKFQLPSKKVVANDPASAISSLVRIPPQEKKSVIFFMSACEPFFLPELTEEYFLNEHKEVKKYWEGLTSKIEVKTPDAEIDALFNKQLLYQLVSSRLWARTGFYQPGGAFGYRDQLQDVTSLCWADPKMAKKHILLAASRQFTSGAVQQWWHPPGNAGVRSDSSDAHLWLVYASLEYIKITGDKRILQEEISFLKTGKTEHRGEVYYSPESTEETFPLSTHLERALERTIYLVGKNGLPLILDGDWNDSLSGVGRDKRGESVWMAMFLSVLLNDYSELIKPEKEKAKADYYQKKAEELKEKIERFCWDGRWYLRAFWDSGEPLGGKQNKEMKIDSLPQSWAVISGLNKGRAKEAVGSANKILFDKKNKVVRLFTPPFVKTEYDPGYILLYPPGVRENGGAYSHASLWLSKANALIGNSQLALDILNTVNPLKRVNSDLDVQIYQGEPYVVPADIYTHGSYVGLSGWTWYTGSASMFYRVFLEDILGFKKEGTKLSFSPSVPSNWSGYTISYKYKKSIYKIIFKKISKNESQRVLLDGVRQKDNKILLSGTKKSFLIEVYYSC